MSTVEIAVGVGSMKKRLEISAPGRSSGLGSVLVWSAPSSSPLTWASHSPKKNLTCCSGRASDFGFGFKMGTQVWVVLVLIYPDLVPSHVLTMRPGIPAAWHLLLHALHRILAHTPILIPTFIDHPSCLSPPIQQCSSLARSLSSPSACNSSPLFPYQ
ncbi:hypothetical protein BJ165DRAFT_1509010 [Panaeolus papilionaceus]|nr:hypothetical protein BJ165DRAFT_1509010 [Panaeolus papilionaceus]